MKKGLHVAVLSLAAVITAAGVVLAAASFTGTWNTAWGPIKMTQTGDQVMGVYGGRFPGRLFGTVSGNRFEFQWIGDNGEKGRGVFVLAPDGNSFTGTWGSGESASNGGEWNGTRVLGGK